jgi:Sulfotransferase family
MKDLLAISAEMKARSPVFIVGEARSGTSILYRTLQKHTSFRPREPNLVETEIFSHLRRTFMFSMSYPQPLIRFMLDDQGAYRDFLRSIRAPRAVSALAIGVNLVVRDRSDLVWYANLSHLVVRSYFFHAIRARGCPRLVEKTPTNTLHLNRLVRTFPRARLLYMYRHPVDVFSSYRRRARADANAGWAARLTPQDFCKVYETSLMRILTHVEAHQNLLMVRYEDFTQRPAEVFESICRFLDECFEPRAVEERDPDLHRWKGDPHLWGEIVPVTKDWRAYMSSAEAEIIQGALSHVMAWLGYDRYRPA